jgi:hypothetical protein
LTDNPLLRTHLVSGSDDIERRETLKTRIISAIQAMAEDPREAKAWRVLDATYLRPGPTQEAAATTLGLPPTTYRRHLTDGIELLSDRLLQSELAGMKTHTR